MKRGGDRHGNKRCGSSSGMMMGFEIMKNIVGITDFRVGMKKVVL